MAKQIQAGEIKAFMQWSKNTEKEMERRWQALIRKLEGGLARKFLLTDDFSCFLGFAHCLTVDGKVSLHFSQKKFANLPTLKKYLAPLERHWIGVVKITYYRPKDGYFDVKFTAL